MRDWPAWCGCWAPLVSSLRMEASSGSLDHQAGKEGRHAHSVVRECHDGVMWPANEMLLFASSRERENPQRQTLSAPPCCERGIPFSQEGHAAMSGLPNIDDLLVAEDDDDEGPVEVRCVIV